MMMQVSIEDDPCPEDFDFVRDRLQEHNAAIVGPDNYAPLAIFARDGSGSIRGGLLGKPSGNGSTSAPYGSGKAIEGRVLAPGSSHWRKKRASSVAALQSLLTP